jgi:hypothetical protein
MTEDGGGHPKDTAQICCVFLPAFTQPKMPSGMMETLV